MKRIAALLVALSLCANAAPPTSITDLSPNIDSNSPAGGDAIGSTLDDYLRGGFAITRRLATNGAIASAASMNIGAVQAEFLTVSGTTGISALGSVASGVRRVLVFEDALTLAHSASLILPTTANITTAAGDVMAVRSIGPGTWRAESYMRASGVPVATVPVTSGGTSVATLTTPYGLLAAGTVATGAVQTLSTGATTEILVGGGASALPVWTTATGSGAPVRATSPTLVTPALGVATATTINKLTFTQPATGSTLTISDGKTLTASNSLTLAGTDGTTMTFPTTTATIARTDAAQTFSGTQIIGSLVGTTASYLAVSSSSLNGAPISITAGAALTFPGATATLASLGGNTFDGIQSMGGVLASTVTATTINGNTLTTGSGTLTFTGSAVATVPTTLTVGYQNIPQNPQNASYTLVLGDAGKHIYMQTAGTYTIPANASVAFPVGTAVTFINMGSASTIPITTDTMYLCGTGTTGTRTLAQYGVATAVKMTSTTWLICGSGLS